MSPLARFTLMICLLAGLLAGSVTSPAMARELSGNLDATSAASVAIALANLEIDQDYAALYGAMHPDSQDLVSESAVAGWYEAEFAPRSPGPISEIVSVKTIDWTWDVTGETYAGAAEVTYRQPFAGVEEDVVVRLVEAGGHWTWFFGRTRAFIDEQMARFDTGASGETASLNPDEIVAVVETVNGRIVERFLPRGGLSRPVVEVTYPDPNAGATGGTALAVMTATMDNVEPGQMSGPTGVTTLTIAVFPDEGSAGVNFQRNRPRGPGAGDDPATMTETLANGETVDLPYAEPYLNGGETNTMSIAQVGAVVIRGNYRGDDGSAIVANTCMVTASGIDLVNAILAGEIPSAA